MCARGLPAFLISDQGSPAAADRGRLPGPSGRTGADISGDPSRMEAHAGSGRIPSRRMCWNIPEAFRGTREGTRAPPVLGISRDEQGRQGNYHLNLKRA